ncbi:MAG: hypothetical protein WBX30_24720, partial [Stellaceae bacterium]
MAWSPPAHNAGIVWVSAPGDYATFNSNHTPDGTPLRKSPHYRSLSISKDERVGIVTQTGSGAQNAATFQVGEVTFDDTQQGGGITQAVTLPGGLVSFSANIAALG